MGKSYWKNYKKIGKKGPCHSTEQSVSKVDWKVSPVSDAVSQWGVYNVQSHWDNYYAGHRVMTEDPIKGSEATAL